MKSYNDPQIIEECINDTFLGAFDNAKQFTGEQVEFRKWICTIAKFKAIDKQRKIAISPIMTEFEDYQFEVKSAEKEFLIKSSIEEFLKMMTKLEQVDRDIFTMKYFLNMKNEEIAQQLGLTKASVDNRLYRGKKRLQQIRFRRGIQLKKLFQQFNNLNIDTDLQPMEVSDFEKEKVKRTVMRGKRKNHLPRNLSVAAAFLVASSITLSVAFPTFAAKLPIVGNIFELFNDNERYVFEKYDTHATDIGVTKESNGISVTVTDAVYDGENITIAYTMESEKDLGERPVLEGILDAEEFHNMYKDYGYFPKLYYKKSK